MARNQILRLLQRLQQNAFRNGAPANKENISGPAPSSVTNNPQHAPPTSSTPTLQELNGRTNSVNGEHDGFLTEELKSNPEGEDPEEEVDRFLKTGAFTRELKQHLQGENPATAVEEEEELEEEEEEGSIDINNEEELERRGLKKIQIQGENEEFLMDAQGNIYDLQGNFIGQTNGEEEEEEEEEGEEGGEF